MKIYTKFGDSGETSLLSGQRVSKFHAQINAYGEIDELSSWLGVFRSALLVNNAEAASMVLQIQSELLIWSSWLAADKEESFLPPLLPGFIDTIEKAIDEISLHLPELKNFVLPGGSPMAAHSHVLRTVCRRAERSVAKLTSESSSHPLLPKWQIILTGLNRLSDYFFVLALDLNHSSGVQELLWRTR